VEGIFYEFIDRDTPGNGFSACLNEQLIANALSEILRNSVYWPVLGANRYLDCVDKTPDADIKPKIKTSVTI
jgi:hypothetical protein